MTFSRRTRDAFWLLILLGLLAPHPSTSAFGGEPLKRPTRTIEYNADVRPILAKNCFSCHGRDEVHRAKKLRLDQREAAIQELEDASVAIVPGSPDESELIARVTAEDQSLRMPPAKTAEKLTPEQVRTLRDWIAQGATTRSIGRSFPPRIVRRLPSRMHPGLEIQLTYGYDTGLRPTAFRLTPKPIVLPF